MLTTAEADQLKSDIGALIDTLTEPSTPPTSSGGAQLTFPALTASGTATSISVTGETIGPGVVNFEEIHVHAGDTLTILPGTELVRIDVPPADPNHGDGGIVVHGTLIAVRQPTDPPIVIRSANPAGHRGHLMCHGDMQLDGVEIRDFGRTTISPLGPSNPIARYACHFHLAGDRPNSRVENCLIHDTANPSPFRYGITVHATNYVTVRNNHIHHKGGAGIYVEDGTEHDCLIEGNIIEDIHGTGGRPDSRANERGFIGAGFYSASGANFVRNNTSRRCTRVGHIYFMAGALATGYKPITGADFGNTAENCGLSGFEGWYIGDASVQSVIENFTATSCVNGYLHYPINNCVLRNWVLQNNQVAMQGGDYDWKNSVIDGWTVRNNTLFGLICSARVIDELLIRNTHCYGNAGYDIGSVTQFYNGGGQGCIPRRITIDNCLLESSTKIARVKWFRDICNLMLADDMYVTGYQQVAGDDFRVYYTDQAAGTIVPDPLGPLCVAAQAPGLTNTQHLAQFGTCIAGSIAPCSTTRPGITGYCCPA